MEIKVVGPGCARCQGNQKINLTNEGFMYAMVKPEKFKEIINEKVDGLLIR